MQYMGDIIVKLTELIPASAGIYQAQMFAERYTDMIDDKEVLAILQAGPDHPEYDATWAAFEGTHTGKSGEFLMYGDNDATLYLATQSN